MKEPKSLEQEIVEKGSLLNTIITAKFGGSLSDAAANAPGADNTQEGGMRITRSSTSGAPGEVQDGKLVNPKDVLAASAGAQDIPPTDLLALAKANDPYSTAGADGIESKVPAGQVVVAAKDGPGFDRVETPDKGLGNVEKEQGTMPSAKRHPAIEKAVTTDVGGQTSNSDPYKTLHAGEIQATVERAKAIMAGARELARAADGTKDHSVGEVEPGEGVPAKSDAAKNPAESAATLARGQGASRAAKAEGHPEDPVPGGSDAAKTPEETAKSWGQEQLPAHVRNASDKQLNGIIVARACGSQGITLDLAKMAAAELRRRAEQKDRPVASMPEGKARYEADADPRDEEAESYWSKAKKDQSRFEREWGAERPLNREQADKLPKLSPQAAIKRSLAVRLAGLSFLAEMKGDEAERLRAKSVRYPRDAEKDMDYAGAAKRTEGEISKEQRARENDSHTFSPMMSRLWSAVGWTRRADLEPVPSAKSMPASEDRGRLKSQIEELKTALKGVKAEDQGADSQMSTIRTRIDSLESELAKGAGLTIGQTRRLALSASVQSLAHFASALEAASGVLAAHHAELRFAADDNPFAGDGDGDKDKDEPKDKPEKKEPEGDKEPADKKKPAEKKDKKPADKPASSKAMRLLEDLGETAEDMIEAIDDILKEMGGGRKKKKDDMGMPPKGDMGLPPKGDGMEKPMGMEKEMPLGQDMPGPLEPGLDMPPAPMPMASLDGPFTRAAEEERAVSVILADDRLSAEARGQKVAALRSQAKWGAVFSKVASREPGRPDVEASYWTVRRNDEVVLRASVKELYPVTEAAEKQAAYDWCATTEYGKKLLAEVKGRGLERTAKLLGISAPLVRTAAEKGKINEGEYYRKVYPGSYVSELTKNYEKKAADERAVFEKKASDAQAEVKQLKEQLAKRDEDIALHARAERALAVVGEAVRKGMVAEAQRQGFVDKAMLMDDKGFDAWSQMVLQANPARNTAAQSGGERETSGRISAKELVRQASAGPGLKTAVVIPQAQQQAPGDLRSNLEAIWKKPAGK